MKRILVPCDFSDQAVSAFRFAVDIANQAKSEVHLIHVVEVPVLMPMVSFEEALFKELREKADKQFQKLISKYGDPTIKVVSKVIFGGMSKMILDYIGENKIDLVVMGTKGVSGAREYLIGSNAEKIVRESSVPVLTVKGYSKASSIRNIVFPNTLDTKMQEDLITKVKGIQTFFKAKIHIVWINTPATFTKDIITNERLETFAKRFMFKDFDIHVYNDFYEESGVANFAHEIKADMIVMGTHGRRGLAHMLGGSVTEDLVNHFDGPVWTYAIKKE